MKKPLVLALIGLGAYLAWKKTQGPVSGIGSPYSDLSGLGKFSIKRATSAVVSSVAAPLQVAVTPLRVAAAPATAAVSAIRVVAQGGSIAEAGRAANTTIKAEAMTPLTVPVKALQPVMTRSMSQTLSTLGSKPGIRVALGRPRPGSNSPTAIVSNASMGPTVADSTSWYPVPGQAGWEYTNASDGSTVFRNQSTNASFYCTSGDMSQIGSLPGAVNMFLYGNPFGAQGDQRTGTPIIAQPDTSSVPGSSGSAFVPSSSDQSYTTGQSYTDPGFYANAAPDPSAPSADGSQVMQQYQAADSVAPAAATKMNPLVVAGTLLAVPLAFMLTGKK